jgi:hypothetical protein
MTRYATEAFDMNYPLRHTLRVADTEATGLGGPMYAASGRENDVAFFASGVLPMGGAGQEAARPAGAYPVRQPVQLPPTPLGGGERFSTRS